jgi:hypothetical protein
MRRTRYPSAGGRSTKKAHPAKINLKKKLASLAAFTRRKPRSPVKFFALYDTTIFDAFSRQPGWLRGWCGCQPKRTMNDEFIDDQPPIGTLTPEARESLRLAMADTPAAHPDKATP